MELTISVSGADGHHVKIGDMDGNGPPRVLAEMRFQLGPRCKVGVNGVQVVDLLQVCLFQLVTYQDRMAPCKCNPVAIECIKAAIAAVDGLSKA
jgi:hypothetical protein